MALFKPIQVTPDMDMKALMKRLYQFNEDLKFTLSNLDLDDNCSKAMLDEIDQRNDMIRTIKWDANQLQIQYEDCKTGAITALIQAEDSIELLVDSGSVVETMLSRMEIYGDSIHMTSGHLVIEATNFNLDINGNATFSGDIIGGSINIGNGKFIVYPNGDCYIDDELVTETLNPSNGIYAAELEVYNDDEIINYISGEVTADECYIVEELNCADVDQRSDGRLKNVIRQVRAEAAWKLCPRVFDWKSSGERAIGFVAQEVESLGLPLVHENQGMKELPYANYVALLAAAVQQNQERIVRLKRRLSANGVF